MEIGEGEGEIRREGEGERERLEREKRTKWLNSKTIQRNKKILRQKIQKVYRGSIALSLSFFNVIRDSRMMEWSNDQMGWILFFTVVSEDQKKSENPEKEGWGERNSGIRIVIIGRHVCDRVCVKRQGVFDLCGDGVGGVGRLVEGVSSDIREWGLVDGERSGSLRPSSVEGRV